MPGWQCQLTLATHTIAHKVCSCSLSLASTYAVLLRSLATALRCGSGFTSSLQPPTRPLWYSGRSLRHSIFCSLLASLKDSLRANQCWTASEGSSWLAACLGLLSCRWHPEKGCQHRKGAAMVSAHKHTEQLKQSCAELLLSQYGNLTQVSGHLCCLRCPSSTWF